MKIFKNPYSIENNHDINQIQQIKQQNEFNHQNIKSQGRFTFQPSYNENNSFKNRGSITPEIQQFENENQNHEYVLQDMSSASNSQILEDSILDNEKKLFQNPEFMSYQQNIHESVSQQYNNIYFDKKNKQDELMDQISKLKNEVFEILQQYQNNFQNMHRRQIKQKIQSDSKQISGKYYKILDNFNYINQNKLINKEFNANIKLIEEFIEKFSNNSNTQSKQNSETSSVYSSDNRGNLNEKKSNSIKQYENINIDQQELQKTRKIDEILNKYSRDSKKGFDNDQLSIRMTQSSDTNYVYNFPSNEQYDLKDTLQILEKSSNNQKNYEKIYFRDSLLEQEDKNNNIQQIQEKYNCPICGIKIIEDLFQSHIGQCLDKKKQKDQEKLLNQNLLSSNNNEQQLKNQKNSEYDLNIKNNIKFNNFDQFNINQNHKPDIYKQINSNIVDITSKINSQTNISLTPVLIPNFKKIKDYNDIGYNQNQYNIQQNQTIKNTDKLQNQHLTNSQKPNIGNLDQSNKQITQNSINDKMKFFSLVKEIKNSLQANHEGHKILMSDLYKESIDNNIKVENYEDFIKLKFKII